MTQARLAAAASALALVLSTSSCGFPDLFTPGADGSATGADSNVPGVDSNVPGVDSAVPDSGGLDSTAADSGPPPAAFTPSNVDPVTLANATGTVLDSFGAVFTAAGGMAGDEVVVDSDMGSMELFRAGVSQGMLRNGGQGLDNGIFFDNQPQATGPVSAGVFVMTDFDVPTGVRVRGIGSASLIFVATGCATVDGDILVGAGEYLLSTGAPFDLAVAANGTTGGPNFPGPGGFFGGATDGVPVAILGGGPGGGVGGDGSGGDDFGGAGGGGYGGGGGAGGSSGDNPGSVGGSRYYCGGTLGTTVCAMATDYNTALIPLVGGSGGGGGGEDGDSGLGGAGGGAIQISALGSMCGVSVTGIIDAGGEGGGGGTGVNNRSGGGGGSGGAILLEGVDVTVTGTVSANGGGGGGGRGCGPDGERGQLSATLAAGGDAGAGCNGTAGGDGGADTTLDGAAGVDDDRDPGGGGGAVGRIRINATTATVTGIASPAQGTSAYNEGPLP